MKNTFTLSLATIAILSITSTCFAADNILQKCIKWYPTRVDWCNKQYPDLVDTVDLSSINKKTGDTFKNPTIQEVGPAKDISGSDHRADRVEAITSQAKNYSSTVLFVKIKTSGNVVCAEDGLSWVIAEKDGSYYAINGLARSWVKNMQVYKSGMWHPVKDAGVGPNSVFGMDQTAELIQIGNELCPVPTDNFAVALANRVQVGEKQARTLGYKYGL